MRLRCLNLAVFLAVPLLGTIGAYAVSCTTQSQMTPSQRDLYERAARSLGTQIQAASVAAVRANTVAAVAAQFDELAASIQQVAPEIKNATLTVNALYNLNAVDLKPGEDTAEFFCAVPGSALVVTVSIPRLPPGDYVVAMLHATGVAYPQQISLILENDPAGSAQWKLAGLYIRPLTAGGHDGVWFWTQARALAEKQQNWPAYFYYQTAGFLLNPVDFVSSPNLQKLQKEAQMVRPADLPGKVPLAVKAGDKNLEVTGVRTQSFQNGLDLVIAYEARDVSGPVATRAQIVELMKAILLQHPELRAAFHGLWVYAYDNNGQPFAIELPMNQIQ